MSSQAHPPSSGSRRRPPLGPLIVIVLVLVSLAWVLWLTRGQLRPAPEFPPVRELPLATPTQDVPPEPR